MKKLEQATVLTPEEVDKVKLSLPESWTKAAGLLARKKKALEEHLRTVQEEWVRHPLDK